MTVHVDEIATAAREQAHAMAAFVVLIDRSGATSYGLCVLDRETQRSIPDRLRAIARELDSAVEE